MASTVRDIARLAGVSAATVSLVLNNRSGVGQETRLRIFQIARQLNYQLKHSCDLGKLPNKPIRLLWIAKHGHILNNNHQLFVADYVHGLEQEASRHGFKLEISSFEEFSPELIQRSIQDNTLAGLVILGTELDETDSLFFRNLDIRWFLLILSTFISILTMST